jgi:hypothetical protein
VSEEMDEETNAAIKTVKDLLEIVKECDKEHPHGIP